VAYLVSFWNGISGANGCPAFFDIETGIMHFTNNQPSREENGLNPFSQRPSGSIFSRSPVWNFSSWLSSQAAVLRSSHGAMPHAEARSIAVAVRALFCSRDN
jgi:hypothetical protein